MIGWRVSRRKDKSTSKYRQFSSNLNHSVKTSNTFSSCPELSFVYDDTSVFKNIFLPVMVLRLLVQKNSKLHQILNTKFHLVLRLAFSFENVIKTLFVLKRIRNKHYIVIRHKVYVLSSTQELVWIYNMYLTSSQQELVEIHNRQKLEKLIINKCTFKNYPVSEWSL